MYGLFQRSGTLKLWQINYCDDDFAACARFKRGAEGRSVPLTLLPNGRDLTLNLPS